MGSTFPPANFFHKMHLCLFSDQNSDFFPKITLMSDPEGGLSSGQSFSSNMKGFIVAGLQYFYCLLTLHGLDGHFENGVLLTEQPLHHRAKLA